MAEGSARLNVLIVGTGMYVCGRGTSTYGTVMPAVLQAAKAGLVGDVLVATRSGRSFEVFDEKWRAVERLIGHRASYRRFPDGDQRDPAAFRRAIAELGDPGAVVVVVPDDLHREVALPAIEAGKHALVVKPLAPTLDDALALVEAARRHGVYGAVEFHKRFDLANLKMMEVLAKGEIGDPLFFHVEYSQRKVVPSQIFADWTAQTSIFQYLGVHYVDIIYFVTGAHPTRLLAVGQKAWLAERGFPVHDAVEVLLEWEMPDRPHRFMSSFLVSWVDPEHSSAMSYQSIKVVGTKGRYESDQKQRGVEVVSDEGGIRNPNPYFCETYPVPGTGEYCFRGYGVDSVTTFLGDALDVATGRVSPEALEGRRPTFRDTLVSTAVVEAARLALQREGTWVTFGPDLRPRY